MLNRTGQISISSAAHVCDKSVNSHRKASSLSPSEIVAGGRQCDSRPTITPTKTCSVNLYSHIKRRVGCSLKRAHCTGNLVPSRKQAAYQLPGTEGGILGPERVPRPLLRQDSSCSNQQHHSGVT